MSFGTHRGKLAPRRQYSVVHGAYQERALMLTSSAPTSSRQTMTLLSSIMNSSTALSYPRKAKGDVPTTSDR